MELPGQRVLHDLLSLEAVNLGRFVEELAGHGFCGFVRLRAQGRALRLLFDSGQFQGARLDDTPIEAGMEAEAVRPFAGAGATLSAVEIPPEQSPILAAVYFGKEIFADLPARMVNLTELVKQYQGAVQNGVLLLANKKLGVGVVLVAGGKWSVATSREEFGKIYADGDSRLALYSTDEPASRAPSMDLAAFLGPLTPPPAATPAAGGAIAAVLEDAYPGKVGPLRDWLEREYRGPADLERALAHIREYVELFLAGRGRGRDLERVIAAIRDRVAPRT